MVKKELVLINSSGCELSREEITEERDASDIIRGWILEIGDTIKVVDPYE